VTPRIGDTGVGLPIDVQFLIVGAASTVLRGDGITWVREDLGNLPGAVNLNDVVATDSPSLCHNLGPGRGLPCARPPHA
jgi:hypothetical protein